MPVYDPTRVNREHIAEALLAAKDDRKFLVDQFLCHRRREHAEEARGKICVPCVLGAHDCCKSADCPCVHHSLALAERIAGRIERSLRQVDALLEQVASA